MYNDPEDATLGSFIICELCKCLQQVDYLEDPLVEVLLEAQWKTGKNFCTWSASPEELVWLQLLSR